MGCFGACWVRREAGYRVLKYGDWVLTLVTRCLILLPRHVLGAGSARSGKSKSRWYLCWCNLLDPVSGNGDIRAGVHAAWRLKISPVAHKSPESRLSQRQDYLSSSLFHKHLEKQPVHTRSHDILTSIRSSTQHRNHGPRNQWHERELSLHLRIGRGRSPG